MSKKAQETQQNKLKSMKKKNKKCNIINSYKEKKPNLMQKLIAAIFCIYNEL